MSTAGGWLAASRPTRLPIGRSEWHVARPGLNDRTIDSACRRRRDTLIRLVTATAGRQFLARQQPRDCQHGSRC
jgi:hypothetical protein